MAAEARPVRIAANSSLACSTALSIFSSASKRVSSITEHSLLPAGSGLSVVRWWMGWSGGDQRADLLAGQGADDRVVPLGAEDEHRQVVLLAQAVRGRVGHAQTLLDHFGERDRVELAGSRVGARIGGVDAVDAVLAHQHDIGV